MCTIVVNVSLNFVFNIFEINVQKKHCLKRSGAETGAIKAPPVFFPKVILHFSIIKMINMYFSKFKMNDNIMVNVE
jgi:hypothetical protein